MVPLQAQNSLSALKMLKKMIVGGAKMSKILESGLSKLNSKVLKPTE
jgi:O-succinylbenzoic acid--CoA ligase